MHTRAIIDPDYAVKLSGKQGRISFGYLLASDNAPGDFTTEEREADWTSLPIYRGSSDKNAYVGVVGLKRDVGKENVLGFIATSYDFIEKHNKLAGFNGRFRLEIRRPRSHSRYSAQHHAGPSSHRNSTKTFIGPVTRRATPGTTM